LTLPPPPVNSYRPDTLDWDSLANLVAGTAAYADNIFAVNATKLSNYDRAFLSHSQRFLLMD